MKQWNGFKIGRLYIDKYDTYHGEDGRLLPLNEDGPPAPMLVVAIEKLPHLLSREPLAEVTFIHRGRAVTYSIPQTWTEESAGDCSRWKPCARPRTATIKKC
jgi:hypothetical protein